MTGDRGIDYDGLAQQAMRGVVRAVLTRVARSGLPGDHHFYIAFDTRFPGVSLSRRLREKYPEEMTIVMQHRFWDLSVNEAFFEVKLTFDGIPERLVVPFAAIRVFFDPSVRYSIQFDDPKSFEQSDEEETETPRRQRHRRAAKTDRQKTGDESSLDAAEEQPASEQESAKARSTDSKTEPPTRREAVHQNGTPSGPSDAAGSDDVDTAQEPAKTAQIFSLDAFRKK